MRNEGSNLKVGVFYPTKTTGVYFRLRKNGTKTFSARRPDGSRSFEACESLEAAKARRAEFVGKIDKGEVIGNRSRSLNSLIEDWQGLRTTLKPRSREEQDRHVRLHIRPAVGRMKVRDINRAVIKTWLAGLKRKDGKPGPLDDGTKEVILATFVSILDLAVDDNLINANPARTLTRRDKPRQRKSYPARVLRDGEFEALLAACGKRLAWLLPILLVAYYTATRESELCGLSWRDVDFEKNTITIRQQYGKGGRIGTPKGTRGNGDAKPATIPLLPEARAVLLEYFMAAEDKSPDAPVFVNLSGRRRNPNDVWRAFDKVRSRAGLSDDPRQFRFHDLRHSAISRLANQLGAVLPQVQAFARHANLQTTFGYVHWIEDATWAEQASAALSLARGAS
jgi:integrase